MRKKQRAEVAKALKKQFAATDKAWNYLEACRANPKFFSLMAPVQQQVNVSVERIVEDKTVLKQAWGRREALDCDQFKARAEDAQKIAVMVAIMLRQS